MKVFDNLKFVIGDMLLSLYPGNVRHVDYVNFKYYNNWSVGTHFHAYYEMHVINCGEVNLFVGDREISLTAGDVCLILPQVSHYTIKSSDDLQSISFSFNIEKHLRSLEEYEEEYTNTFRNRIFSEFSYYNKLLLSIDKNAIIRESKSKAIIDKFQRYTAIKNENYHIFEIMLKAFFIGIIEEFLDAGQVCEDRAINFYEKKINTYNDKQQSIEVFFYRNFNKDVLLADFAEHISTSVSQANRILNQIYGMSFKKLITKHRMEYAQMLLRDGKYKLGVIAQMCGYSSYNGFYATIKKYYKDTPETSQNFND